MKESTKRTYVNEGTFLWEPSSDYKAQTNLVRYMAWLRETKNLVFDSYHDLWKWSITELESFWISIWEYFEIQAYHPYSKVLTYGSMPGQSWFADAKLNYAEQALRRRDKHPAVIFKSEDRPQEVLTYEELYRSVSSVACGLKRLGVKKGDRVVAYMPNIPETLIAFLAVASIGAIWSSCSPELGIRSVAERFHQIKPTVFFAVDGYTFGGRTFNRIQTVADLCGELPTLKHVVMVPYLSDRSFPDIPGHVVSWQDLSDEGPLDFEPVPFEHPLWILYSSGTTGVPKAMVQGHGGIMLEHLKFLSLHLDLKPEDRFFWSTTSGWMMWNLLIGGLLVGTTVILYDGSPRYPDMNVLWRLAQEMKVTYFGASAPFLQSCMMSEVEPGRAFDLTSLKGIGSTGAPLTPENSKWVYENVGDNLLLGSASGGTDLCTPFIGPCPLHRVYAGELQWRCLGADIESYDSNGRAMVDEVGELVIKSPMPSMPIYFWDDSDGYRYRESYFETFPGVWRHGDLLKITRWGTCVIYGRSDSTLNRGGVRMGTSEFYRLIEDLPWVMDSLVIDTGQLGTESLILLFLVLKEGTVLDDSLRKCIDDRLHSDLSPRHVPDKMFTVQEIPRTLNGKKLEVPVKKILTGTPLGEAVNLDAMSNPDSLRPFVDLAGSFEIVT